MNFEVVHRTEYHYEAVVSSSYGQMHLLPRHLPGQVCHGTDVVVDPRPSYYQQRTDFFGNNVAYFEIASPHRTLTVTTTSSVEVEGRHRNLSLVATQGWEHAVIGDGRSSQTALGGHVQDFGEESDILDAGQFCLDSPLAATSEGLAEYAHVSFTAGRPVIEALVDLTDRIHTDFPFTPGATSVTTTAEEVLQKRLGVCQDFAHLAIGCLRSLGLAARYVSGYLETIPPPGKPRIVGNDVSHAWASLWVPVAGWVDLDPTNHQLVNDRYITTACGRDYSDVPPLKGVIFTEGTTHDLEVSVDVLRVNEGLKDT